MLEDSKQKYIVILHGLIIVGKEYGYDHPKQATKALRKYSGACLHYCTIIYGAGRIDYSIGAKVAVKN